MPAHKPFEDKFFVLSGGCWEWRGQKTASGYGQFRPEPCGKTVYAHRHSYEVSVGPIPDGLTIDHLCRNKACVNPDHLEPVTLAENIRRARRLFCRRGHQFVTENLYVRPNGDRRCRICRDAYQRAWKERRKHAQVL